VNFFFSKNQEKNRIGKKPNRRQKTNRDDNLKGMSTFIVE
jgi:hypothetical protein